MPFRTGTDEDVVPRPILQSRHGSLYVRSVEGGEVHDRVEVAAAQHVGEGARPAVRVKALDPVCKRVAASSAVQRRYPLSRREHAPYQLIAHEAVASDDEDPAHLVISLRHGYLSLRKTRSREDAGKSCVDSGSP